MKAKSMLRQALLVGLLLLATATSAQAQRWSWPENPENLKVLPETTTPQQLSATMRSFTRALGVRCQYCHVGEEGQPFTEWDFASDEKETKQKARIMMEMVQSINGTHLAKLDVPADERMEVTCITCHHGVEQPVLLQDLLVDLVPAHGVDSTIARYRDLRTAYFGGFSYDFGERTLLDVADELVRQENTVAALKILNLNLEMSPASWQTHFAIGEVYREQGDKEAARAQYEKALEINPNLEFVQQQIDQLKQE
jgi:tetratricopeptide (TPR) repeat protein